MLRQLPKRRQTVTVASSPVNQQQQRQELHNNLVSTTKHHPQQNVYQRQKITNKNDQLYTMSMKKTMTTTMTMTTTTEPDYEQRRYNCVVGFLIINCLFALMQLYRLQIIDVQSPVIDCSQLIDKEDSIAIPQMTQQQQETFNTFNSNIRFVFTIGLEGTGHHLLMDLTKNAPYVKEIQSSSSSKEQFFLLFNELAERIYHGDSPHDGLLSAFCDFDNVYFTKQETKPPSDDILLNALVQQLQIINDHTTKISITDSSTSSITTIPVTVPINSMEATHNQFGMMSYPNYASDCRNLNYPNLELFYHACTLAKVDCGHFYIYRDVYSIIKSTSINRSFNKHPLTAIQLYIAQMSIIYTQMKMFPGRTIGCTGFYDNELTLNDIMDPIYHLFFSWKENGNDNESTWSTTMESDFTTMVQQVYRAPKKMTPKERIETVPHEYHYHMKSMEKLSKNILALCRQQATDNKYI